MNVSKRAKDITGRKFNRLTALSFSRVKSTQAFWWFRCDCGNKHEASGAQVKAGNTKSCGCLVKEIGKKNIKYAHEGFLKKVNDKYLNKKFGRWLVVGPYKYEGNKPRRKWLCQCECGTKKWVLAESLLKGASNSCGCIGVEKGKPNTKTHGMSKTLFYRVWCGMKDRCYLKTCGSFVYYGKRGIKICDRWLKFENFRDDMHSSYLLHIEQNGKKNTQIDRIDVDGDYEPGNCRWATAKEQANNKRKIST